MSLEGPGRVLVPEKGKTLLYVGQDVAKDSAWPFKAGDHLRITIDAAHARIIIEKADPKTRK